MKYVVAMTGLLLSLSLYAQDETSPASAAARTSAPVKPLAALPAPKAMQSRLLGIAATADRLIAVGQQGVILESGDGLQWRQVPSPTSSMLNRVRFGDDRNGWIVGYDASVMGTGDGGRSWRLLHFDAGGRALHDLLFLDARRGIAVGSYGTVLVTEDGGAHWQPQASLLTEPGLHLNGIQRLGDGSLLVVGESGLLGRSTDRGQTWQLLKSPYVGSWFGAMPDGDKGALVFGMRGNVFSAGDVSKIPVEDLTSPGDSERQSSDAAVALAIGWKKFDNGIRESLFGGLLTTPRTAVLVGVNGVITEADLENGVLQPLQRLKDEPLADVAVFRQQLVVVGRRGVQMLGARR